jgi:hypothetical protein
MDDLTIKVETPAETPAPAPPAPPAPDPTIPLEVGQLMERVKGLETVATEARERAQAAHNLAESAIAETSTLRTRFETEPLSNAERDETAETTVVKAEIEEPETVAEAPPPQKAPGLFRRIFLGA